MGERISQLNNAAQQGNIDALYVLIGEDVRLLEAIDELPFVDTPLHIAASAGDTQHIQFAMEVMRLRPSFARKPNPNGDSPIHLAQRKGRTQMFCRLLQVDGSLVRVKGRGGRTPLHNVAAVAETDEELDRMDNFLSGCPNSIEDVTIHTRTALHIALVENNNVKAFIRLVRWLRENKSENAREMLNRQDEAGNTVLHEAVFRNKTEAVCELLNFGVNLNAKNLEGRTAQDLLQEHREVNSEIRDMLNAGALSCLWSFLPIVNWNECYIGKPKVSRNTVLFIGRLRVFSATGREASRLSNDDRNALLVVAALLITITYQLVISPPGGLWQDTKYVDQSSSNAPAPAPAPALDHKVEHYAGTSIGHGTFVHFQFVAVLNSITFTLSTIMTFLLLPRGYTSALFKMALVQLWVSYYYTLAVILDCSMVFVSCLIVLGTGLCLVLVVYCRHFYGARKKGLQHGWILYLVYACLTFLMVLVYI